MCFRLVAWGSGRQNRDRIGDGWRSCESQFSYPSVPERDDYSVGSLGVPVKQKIRPVAGVNLLRVPDPVI